jgi:hypothetical protein
MACQKFMGCDYSIRWYKRACNSSKKTKGNRGVKSLIERELRALGIRTKLKEGKKRYEFATDHGLSSLKWLNILLS